ncbi:hypothetical protein CYMTET_17590 [Cymbomonas tetramitiformis]|uniref:RNA-directed DNA polymerase n=1 Tax=Cymbomonas tetramitiformis TaxID=36881 RepID=A0AAE0GA12_9CHLO|nr:hypothetical protein CYMTET_17590 [Cymbomonas tetramitiformis]
MHATLAATDKTRGNAVLQSSWDVDVVKLVARDTLGTKESSFSGSEPHRQLLWDSLVTALESSFVNKDTANEDIVDLVDVTKEVHPIFNDILLRALVSLTTPHSPARRWVDASARISPRDGKRALLEVTKRLLPPRHRPLRHHEELLGISFGSSDDPEPLVAQFDECLKAIAASGAGSLDEKAAKRQLLAALDPEFYREVITPLRLDTELAKVGIEEVYTHILEECPLCPGHFHDTARCPAVCGSCDVGLRNAATDLDEVVSDFQTAFDDEDDKGFAELCQQHDQPLVRDDPEPFTYPVKHDVGLRAWHQRYGELDVFFSDLAVCSLTQAYLENAHGEAIALKQAVNETAAEYFSRLETRMASVNFLAGRVPNCVEMTNLSMLSTYRRGLKYAPKVMRRLRAIHLDVSKPEEWERKAVADDIPGTHNALLKIREVAEEVESDIDTEAAQRRSQDRPPRAVSFANPPPRTPFYRRTPSSSRPALAMLENGPATTVAAAVTPLPPPPGLSRPDAPKVRRCFACGSAEHIVRNCTDEAKLKEWRANAPARLANSPGFVAAVVWAIEQQEDISSVDGVPEEFSEEVLALATCEDEQSYQTLAALAGIELVEGDGLPPTLSALEKRSEPVEPRRARGRRDPWGQRPHPKSVAFTSGTRLRRTYRSAGAPSPPRDDLSSHPLAGSTPFDEPSLPLDDGPAYTQARIEGRRGRRVPRHRPPIMGNNRGEPRDLRPRPRVVLPLPIYQSNLADPRKRLTAWHWKRDLYSLPLEVAMQKVRRALRKSPEAAKDLVDKMSERVRSRVHSGSRSPKERVNRANQLAERIRIAREPQDRKEGHQRIALWHLLSHDGRQQVPESSNASSHDLYAAWRELSPAEQQKAIATSSPDSSPGSRLWEKEGARRAAARSSTSLCTLDTEVGTIPGTAGDVGLPGAWCSLHAVHQYKMRKLGPSPLGASPPSSSLAEPTTETTSSHHDNAPATPGGNPEGSSYCSEAEETSAPSSLCFTQQMTTVRTHEADEAPPCLDSHPIAEDPEVMEEESSVNSLCFTQQMAAAGTPQTRTDHQSSHQLAHNSPAGSPQHDEDPLTHGSLTNSVATHVSPTTSGTTHVSPTVSGTTHVSPTTSGTTHVSPTTSDTTHVSPTTSDTTHVSPTSSECTSAGTLLTASADNLVSHPTEDVDLLDEEFYAACRQTLEECREASDNLLPNLKCKSIRTDGGVQWKTDIEGTLAAAHDEEGPLLLVFYATLRGHTVKVLIDSGASDNFISEQSAKRCGLTTRAGSEMRVTLADGSVKITGATAYAKFNTHTTTGTYTENALALRILPLGIQVDVILGGRWLRSHSPVTLGYEGNGSVSFLRKSRSGKIGDRVTITGCSPGKASGDRSPKGTACAGLVDEVFLTPAQLKKYLVYAETQKLRGNDDPEIQPAWLMVAEKSPDDTASAFAATAIDSENAEPAADTEDAEVSPEWTLKFQDFWGEEYKKEMTTALPNIDGLRHDPQDEANINLDPELSKKGPPCQRIYKKSAEELRQLRERVETLMSKGYIRPSSSPYAAPCLMVPKPGNPKELRLVIDYRLLNRQTVKDKYPLPDIQMMFDEMQGAKFFSSFDAVDGFWQVPMAPGDVEKTAFTTQMGSYEWLVMPQGLQNSPSQYQRRMQRALGHLPFVRIFIDDVVVFSNTAAEHYEHVKQLLLTCREKGVFLKRSKCQLLKKSLRFLGHCISADGCRPQHDKVAAVRDWPELETVTHVRQFLGLAGYYRRFIHCFSEIAQPLTRLTKSDVPWEWGPMQQWAFEELKKALTSAPVLALPNIKGAADGTAPFVVQTDASGIALGGVLMQDNGDGLGLRVIAYESRQFSAAEQNYHTGERELGALHHCTTVTWRHYLIFTNFRIQGDHRPLEWLMEPGRELSRRQARWYMDLVEVGVPRMEYIKGALLLVPDALSRRPDFKDKDVREGLKEAGVIDPTSDLPKDPLATLESEYFSSSPPAAHPHWAQTVDCWLSAVETLSVAEQAMDMGETIALVNPKLYKGMKEDHLDFDTPDWPAAESAKPVEAPHKPPDRAPPQIRITRSMSRAGKASTTPAPPQLASPKTRTPMSQADTSVAPTEKVLTSSPTPQQAPQQSTPSPVLHPQKRQAPPEDSQNWRVRAEYSSKYAEKFGPFDVDACCDLGGRNRQADRFWTDCLSEKWRGLRVWCNPPYNSKCITVEAILNKYIAEWKTDPENTSAVFVLPDHQSKLPAWRKLFRKANMQIVEVVPTHDDKSEPNQFFENPDGRAFDLRWPVLIVHAPPAKPQPARVRHPRTAPAVIRTGEAADFRDAASQQSDSKFLRALKAEYTREGTLRSLREKVKAAPHQCLQDFRLVGEVVWRTAAGRYQLVLGEDSPLREVVIRHAHESLSSGHTGRDKTLERVLRRFYWRGAAEDVGTWVASCAVCQSVRPRGTYPDGLLNPHSIPNRPWQDVAVDFVTGLPVSERGNDAFVAFTCKLTKMVHVVPMNFGDSSAAVVARIYFDSVWRLHGAPMKIVSDRDPRFQDAFWQELMRLMGVKVARTTPYNPRSDGQAEHSNRVIEDMLRSFVDANVEDWDLFTTNVEFAINDSRSESTGFTPFELVFGFSPLSQLDLFLEAAQSTAGRRTGGVGTAHEVAVKFSSQLRDARQRLELAQQRQREQFDRRHGQREYAVGDLVWIEAKHLTEKVMDRSICRKLTKRWHGPVPVTERFFSDVQMTMPEADRGAPVAYRLRLPPHWRIHDVFAQHRLKPYTSGQDAFAARDHLAVPEEVVVDGQKEAHVERILARRVRSVRGKEVEEWKVRWTGYSKAHDQWRTRDKLERGSPLQQLREFEQARLHMEAQVRDEATRRREQRGRHSAQAGMTLAHLITNPCDELDQLEQMEDDIPLPWERQERVEDGSLALVTELLAIQAKTTRTPRILVLFSGTGSVEREFLNCFPSASVVTLDSGHIWQPTHVCDILQWDYRQYPPGFFDVIWASPPCRQYSQARTTGGPPDLPQADKIVRRALQIIDYLEPKHWFMENPRGRFPNALRLRPMMRQLPPPLVCTYCMYDGQPVLIQRLLSLDLTRSRLEQVDLRVYIPCQHSCYDNFSDIYASATLKTRFRFQVAPFFLKVVPWLVSALQTAFVTEDIGFAPLFLLDNATLPISVEANNLLFSTLELMVDPMSPAADWMDSSHSSFPADGKRVLLELARRMLPTGDPFQGQADMLGVRISAGVDPHDAIGDFYAALKAARTRATLLDEDVKALFTKALDTVFYQPVVSRLLLHDQRAAHDLLTIQQWVRECYAAHVKAGTATTSVLRYSHGEHFMERSDGSSGGPGELADLSTMILDLKGQLAAFVASDRSEPSPLGYTPRADKPDRRMKTRFAAEPLARGGNWSQSVSKKVAFHRDTGATIPYCQNDVCAKGKARHWHRDCSNGGRNGLSAYAFAEEAENSVLATKFQHAIDNDNAAEFDALCMLAGGKPDIFADLSACSFCEEDVEAMVYAITEFTDLARNVEASTFNVNTFTANVPVVSEPAAYSPAASVESDEEWTGPPNPMCLPVTRSFADFIASTGFTVEAPDEPSVNMNILSAVEKSESEIDYEPETYATSDSGDEGAPIQQPPPRYGCGRSIPGLGRSFLTSSLVCALFVICATAAPHTASGVGGADWLLPLGTRESTTAGCGTATSTSAP